MVGGSGVGTRDGSRSCSVTALMAGGDRGKPSTVRSEERDHISSAGLLTRSEKGVFSVAFRGGWGGEIMTFWDF